MFYFVHDPNKILLVTPQYLNEFNLKLGTIFKHSFF